MGVFFQCPHNHTKKWSFTKCPTPYEGRKEGNVLFNDALNTFYLQLFGALAGMRNKIINNSHVAKSLLSRKEVFYLMTLSIHFIDGYMVLELFLIPSSAP